VIADTQPYEQSKVLEADEGAIDYGMFVRGAWARSDPSYMRPLKLERPNRHPLQ
jgi:hypothetical protein